MYVVKQDVASVYTCISMPSSKPWQATRAAKVMMGLKEQWASRETKETWEEKRARKEIRELKVTGESSYQLSLDLHNIRYGIGLNVDSS